VSTRPLAVVTGASGGIGQAICLRLVKGGYDIIAQYNSRSLEAERLQARLNAEGGNCTLVKADLGVAGSVELVVAALDERLSEPEGGTVSALVNSAALMLGPGFGSTTTDEFDRYFAVNTKAPFFLSQHVAQRMSAGGSIVNISSAGVHFSSPGDIVYSMTKAALEALSFHAAERLAARGIRINSIIPGFTDNGHDLFSNSKAREHMSSFAVLGGVSETSTVADAVAFLVSSESSRTTGTTLDVSGGSTIGARPRQLPRVSLRGGGVPEVRGAPMQSGT
jgi:3-oxoacyl-[acyl-carrier protein] reductase